MKNLRIFESKINDIKERWLLLKNLCDRDLRKEAKKLKRAVQQGVLLQEIIIETYALACEVSWRVLKMRPFDVQIAAAIAMHQGKLIQMDTGEGKTLVAVLPAFLNSLAGKGVHVLTFNDYLARRDANWMRPIFEFMGISVGYIQEENTIKERKKAYLADVTYLTAKEAGFDFLRDQRCQKEDDVVHRPFHFAIIDEARVPLVIAGDMSIKRIDLYQLAKLVDQLKANQDYETDEYSHNVNLTHIGLDKLEDRLDCGNLYKSKNNQLLATINLALHAKLLLHRDVDYIVKNKQIELVDHFTGRITDKRRWPYGLQTAIEAKEGLRINPEGIILGSIILQHFLSMYPKLTGMTATAELAKEEFDTFYHLNVEVIPPNKPCIRKDLPDVVFTHLDAKIPVLIEEILKTHQIKRPVLVGTTSVKESEILAHLLKLKGIPCNVLNARNDELEATLIEEAGALGAITISTNMAGRGTDIRLGGKDQIDRDEVLALGGLYVIGTNLHESRRIDNQLRGRAGRQGDPGSSRFFISMEDELMIRYHLEELLSAKLRKIKQDFPFKNPLIVRKIKRAQRIVEGRTLTARKTLLQYTFMVEEQRKIIQQKRRNILFGREMLTLVAKRSPQKHQKYFKMFGTSLMQQVEKEITLYFIDKLWADYLLHISHLREGIHLFGLGGKSPIFEFHKVIIQDFDQMQKKTDDKIVEIFNSIEITKDGIDAEKEGLNTPSSTWTYMIDDNPFENQLVAALICNAPFTFQAAPWLMLMTPIILGYRLFKRLKSKNKL